MSFNMQVAVCFFFLFRGVLTLLVAAILQGHYKALKAAGALKATDEKTNKKWKWMDVLVFLALAFPEITLLYFVYKALAMKLRKVSYDITSRHTQQEKLDISHYRNPSVPLALPEPQTFPELWYSKKTIEEGATVTQAEPSEAKPLTR